MKIADVLGFGRDSIRIVLLKFQSMAFPIASEMKFPLDDYQMNGDGFLKDCYFDGDHWGLHLGEDCVFEDSDVFKPVMVKAAGKGKVVYSDLRPGWRKWGEKPHRNWGNIIIIAHKNPGAKKIFFSVYGHLGLRLKEKGDPVKIGEPIGTIARANSKENGMWEESHLHFGIYTGPYPWKMPEKRKLLRVLPGYYREDQELTLPEWWQRPTAFIKKYQRNAAKNA